MRLLTFLLLAAFSGLSVAAVDISTTFEVTWGNTGSEDGFYHAMDGSGQLSASRKF
jgi:hypothetical protein